MLISTLHPHQWKDKKFKRYKSVLLERWFQPDSSCCCLCLPRLSVPAAALYCHISNKCQTDNKKYKPRLKVEPDTLGHLLSCALYIFNSHQVGCLSNIFTVIRLVVCCCSLLTQRQEDYPEEGVNQYWQAEQPEKPCVPAYFSLPVPALSCHISNIPRLMSKEYKPRLLELDIVH